MASRAHPKASSDAAELSLKKVQDGANPLARAALRAVDLELPWYRELPKQDRTYVDLVIRAGINSFVQWFANRDQAPTGVREMFDAAPVELTKTISLRQTLELTRVIVDVIEKQADAIAISGQERDVREAILQFSRDVAFSAAEVYAQAAELRGAWDARLQAQALDALVEGVAPDKLVSNFRALSWNTKAPVTVLVGSPPPEFSESAMIALRRKLQGIPGNALVGLQGDQLVMVYCAAPNDDAGKAARSQRQPRLGLPVSAASGAGRGGTSSLVKPGSLLDRASKGYVSGLSAAASPSVARSKSNVTDLRLPPGVPSPPAELLELFGPGPLVIGPLAPTVAEAGSSVQAALSAWRAARGWAGAPRPVLASDLLPERALLGDEAARSTLVHDVYTPIKAGKNLLDTLSAYLENGRSLEAAARDLDIHVNTARYRLNNIAELTGWDPLNPREAYVLQTALTLGSLTP